MYYIIFDLEFNQDFSSLQASDEKRTPYPFEIIQIGAIKLDINFNTVATFNRYIKPTIYEKISPFITELTGITTEQLVLEEPFPAVYQSFLEFIEDTDSVLCIWGMSDIRELFRNADAHQLNHNQLSRTYINLQPYISLHFNFPPNHLLRLENAVRALNIPITQEFHDALNDAYYTAELFKKIYDSSFETKIYDPSFITIRPKVEKRELDIDSLLKQFEKMYARKITDEEQQIIILAYKMGRTNQFLK